MNDNDKKALLDGTATIPYKITVLGDTEEENIILTENDIVSVTYEDYRYVDTATICVGQFVARTISGTLIKPNSNFIIENKEIKVEIGVKTNNTTNYYSLGNFLITEPEDGDTTDQTSFESMDYTKKFNKEFDGSGLTYPCTALQLAQYCCNQCGVELATTSFANSDFPVLNNQYETGDTYRKVMQDIGKLAYSWIRIGWDNKCYIDFSIPDDTIDAYNSITTYNYYDLTVQNEVFGPVNRVVIGMSDVEGENVYIEDKTSIAQYGLCELQILDNNITYTPELRQQAISSANRLFGLTYTPLEVNTTGHPWLLGKELIKIEKSDETSVTTIPFNRTIEYSGHIKSKLSSPADTKIETEYKNPGNLETAIKQTRIIVDKQNQTITQIVKNVDEHSSQITQIQQDIDSIEQSVSEVIDLTREVTDIGSVETSENATSGYIVGLKIYGDVVPYYPNEDLYPSTDFYTKPSVYKLTVEYTENDVIKKEETVLPFDYLTFLGDVFDEFTIDIDGNVKQIKRIGYTENGEKYVLPEEQIIDRGVLNIRLYEGVNKLYLNYYMPNIYLKYAVVSEMTDLFATKIEMNSSIKQESDNIKLEVNGAIDTLDENLNAKIELKVDTENLISEINASANIITLTGNRIIIDSDNLKISEDGTLKATNAILSGIFRRYSSDTGYLSIEISGQSMYLYDWREEGLLAGTISSVRDDLGYGNRSGINLYCPYDGMLYLGFDTNDDGIVSMFSFDARRPDEPPYIRNTANGTLFNDNPNGGIKIKNGLITDWNLKVSNGTISAGNVEIEVIDGLITGWNYISNISTLSDDNYNNNIESKYTNPTPTYNTYDSKNDKDILVK